jgi:predicted hydrocarbon binding protein
MSENSILAELIYDRSSGSLLYKGVRYLLIRPETIAGFQKALFEKYGKEAEDSLFKGGFNGGSLSAKKCKELYKFSDLEVIEFMMSMGNQIGWGHFDLLQFDPDERRLCVCVTHSPFAQAYGISSHGVCHLIRGVLAGIAAVLFEVDCTAGEIECRARGDKRCLFVIEAE